MHTSEAIVATHAPAEAAEAPRNGCPHCADIPPGRLSFAALSFLVGRHLKLERGLLRTLVDLTLRPGHALRVYFEGTQRRRYVNPVSYSLLAAAASLLVFELYEDGLRAWMAPRIIAETNKQMPDGVSGAGPASEFARLYVESMFEVMQRTTFTSLALSVPFAGLLWLLFRGPRLNVAEAMAFGLYAMGTGLFLHSLFISPLLAVELWDFAQWAGVALYLAIPLWMGLAYFGPSLRNALRIAVAVFGGFALGVFAIYVVVGVMVAVRMLGH